MDNHILRPLWAPWGDSDVILESTNFAADGSSGAYGFRVSHDEQSLPELTYAALGGNILKSPVYDSPRLLEWSLYLESPLMERLLQLWRDQRQQIRIRSASYPIQLFDERLGSSLMGANGVLLLITSVVSEWHWDGMFKVEMKAKELLQ